MLSVSLFVIIKLNNQSQNKALGDFRGHQMTPLLIYYFPPFHSMFGEVLTRFYGYFRPLGFSDIMVLCVENVTSQHKWDKQDTPNTTVQNRSKQVYFPPIDMLLRCSG